MISDDNLGSARMVIDSAGAVKDKYKRYFAYGGDGLSTISTGQKCRYTGQPYDDDGSFNLYYYGARYYDPVLGRFTSRDPLAQKYPAWSPYAYTLDNPLKNIDKNGQETAVYSVPMPLGTKHLFVVVRNENLGVYTSKGYYPQNRTAAVSNWILGTSFGSGKKIELRTDLPSELGKAKRLAEGKSANVKLEAVITPPSGQTSDQFDQKVLQSVTDFAFKNVEYNITGPNSNTMVDDLIEATGAKIPDIEGAVGQNYGEQCGGSAEIGHGRAFG